LVRLSVTDLAMQPRIRPAYQAAQCLVRGKVDTTRLMRLSRSKNEASAKHAAASTHATRDCHCRYCKTRLPSSLAWMLTLCKPWQRAAKASLRVTNASANAAWREAGTSYSIIWVNHRECGMAVMAGLLAAALAMEWPAG